MTPEIGNALEVANEMADAARAAILPFFRQSISAQSKQAGYFDPVTEADRAAETAMRDVLERRRPEDGIFGEEHGTKPSQSGLTWVLDPIDGTRGFVAGTPTWGVLIALSDAERIYLSVIDQPYIGERFVGTAGEASMTGPLGSTELAVRKGISLEHATLFTTFPEVGRPEDRAAFQRVAERVQLTRYGCDCYAYALLAAGQIDLVIEAGLAPYDIQAPAGLIEAAGGIVTTWDGASVLEGGRALAAATPELHAQAMALLAAE